MFDVGFSELLVIGVVALIVIGPERLPTVARTAGVLLGRLQRYVNSVKADINREIQLDELKKLQQQMAEQTRAMEESVSAEMKAVETSLQELEKPIVATSASPAEAAPQGLEAPAVPASDAGSSAPPLAAAQTAEELAAVPQLQLELGLGATENKNGKG